MSRHRRLAAVGAAAVLALLGAGSAFAATPQQIYRDLADNNRLDKQYKRADLERAFNLKQVLETDGRPRTRIREPESTQTAPAVQTPRRRERRVPFSGIDVALLVAGGGPLLLIGVGIRRRLANGSAAARVVSG